MKTLQKTLTTLQKMRQLSTPANRLGGSQRFMGVLVALAFWCCSVPALATDFYKNFAIFNGNYYQSSVGTTYTTQLQGANLGSFNSQTDVLTLGGEANTYSTNGDKVLEPQIFYRVYLNNTTPGDFAPLTLKNSQVGVDNNAVNTKWFDTTTKPNLLAATSIPGDYTVEVFFQGSATYNNSGGSGKFYFYDNRGSSNYKAYFKVTNPQGQWNGSTGDHNWFTAANWTPAKVPDQYTDVTIPYAAASTNYIQLNYGVAQVRSLTLEGNPDLNSPNAQTFRQNGGELQVFGDFNNPRGNYQQNTSVANGPVNGVFTLAGNTTQTFDGSLFYDVRIQGGSNKILRGRMTVSDNLAFVNGGGTLVTRTDNPTDYSVDLINKASLSGEDNNNYILGIVRKLSVPVAEGDTNDFGNIGLTLNPTSGSPGVVNITRQTGPQAFTYTGVGTSHSIRRGFIVQADNPTGITYNMTFKYLDNELQGIQENNLQIFRSVNGGVPFENLAGTVDNAYNTVTRTGITSTLASTFTLGDKTNPLPIVLASFTAAGTAQGVALKWVTASELNNKGFGIERQLAGATDWQAVGYVNGTNAANGSTYSYLDKTVPASTTQAYYRLRQEDTDGKLTYSPVVAVSLAATSTELTLYPVPLDNRPLQVAFAEAGQAGNVIEILNMQGQRVGRFANQTSDNGAVSLPLDNLAPGVYLLRVQVPGQGTRYARFVKQ